MMRKRWTRIWISMVLAVGALLAGCAKRAQAADDTARFYGTWVASFEYNGQLVIMESTHDGSGYKNYVRLPAGVTAAGNGNYSAANGKWSATATVGNDSGTYKFIDDYTAVCTDAAGVTATWRRDDTTLPAGIAQPNYQQVLAAYQQAANAGATWAMTGIGDLYLYGQGVPVDDQQAMGWYQKAAAGGDADAIDTIGYLYAAGLGVAKDYKQALAWYQKAAAAGNYQGMYNVGVLYEDGEGVAQDYQQAMLWFRKAAVGDSAGSALAMNEIGFFYNTGKGVAVNYQQAMAWYQKAANAGNGTAMANIGNIYDEGLGVAANDNQAIPWIRAAASLGNTLSVQWLKQRGLF